MFSKEHRVVVFSDQKSIRRSLGLTARAQSKWNLLFLWKKSAKILKLQEWPETAETAIYLMFRLHAVK